MSTDAKDFQVLAHRLGSPPEVATTAAAEYRRAHFCRRHPILMFVVMPTIALPLLWAAALTVVALAVKLSGFGEEGTLSTHQLPTWLLAGLSTVVFSMVLLPIVFAAWLFCRVARTSRVPLKWPLVACAILAVIGSAAFLDVSLPGSNQRGLLHDTRFKSDVVEQNSRHGFVTMGLGLSVSKRPRWWQVVQFAVPLGICGLAVGRELESRRRQLAH